MDEQYWQTRWQRGETGFHLPRPHPKLVTLWPQQFAPVDCPVFVPLCGKSLDLRWLAERGHTIIGVELSVTAVQAFFAEQGLRPSIASHGSLQRYQAGPYEIYCGDFFALTAADLAGVTAVYDRAALVALPEPMRRRYVAQLRQLLPTAEVLLLSLVYLQDEMAGPPFSVSPTEVRQLFVEGQADTRAELLIDQDILCHEPRFAAKGVTSLHEQAWRLHW